ncbi:sigma factor G inhibitor Gin [Alicyclobacillus sp. SO9]|uniref:sigma factor G inhibitor Gin n=1 Tax=Alicyclobacillus sp. SO9 TaxID=2665646 RepID=UPI00351C6BCF
MCEQPKEQGIRVCGQFICYECEREMVHTDTSEPSYQNYVLRLRRIWDAYFLPK